MGLLQRLSHDLRAGWVTLRHGTAKAATRALEEGELLRYRLELRKVDQQLDDLHSDIGERTIELHDRGETVDRTKLLLEMNDITVEGELGADCDRPADGVSTYPCRYRYRHLDLPPAHCRIQPLREITRIAVRSAHPSFGTGSRSGSRAACRCHATGHRYVEGMASDDRGVSG